MQNVFDQVLSAAAGAAAVILFSNMVELDWQLVFVCMRDATYGRWMPEIRIVVERLAQTKGNV